MIKINVSILTVILFVSLPFFAFSQSRLSQKSIIQLQLVNKPDAYVEYTGYWDRRYYREYFAKEEKKAKLTKAESRIVGKWYEWESYGPNDAPERLTAINGNCFCFLPDKTFFVTYDRYPGTLKVYYLIGQWKIEKNVLYVKNTLIAYTSDPEINYENNFVSGKLLSNVCIYRFTDDWYKLYGDIDKKVDWKYGYTYEGFKPLHLPEKLLGSYYSQLRPDIRRVIAYNDEEIEVDQQSPLIWRYEKVQKILSGDKQASINFAQESRHQLPNAEYVGYWDRQYYREYFAKEEKKAELTQAESRIVGVWGGETYSPQYTPDDRLTAINGSSFYFLPDKTFFVTYDRYPGTLKVYYLIGQWKVEKNVLYVKNALMAYTTDNEIRYKEKDKRDLVSGGLLSNVCIYRFIDDWYELYDDIDKKIDWEHGYTYEGFKPLHLPGEMLGPYYSQLQPDTRRVIGYEYREMEDQHPCIWMYEREQKIISGDKQAIQKSAEESRSTLPDPNAPSIMAPNTKQAILIL